MKTRPGVTVSRLGPSSPLARAGVRPGDHIAAVNGEPVADELDLRFLAASPAFRLTLRRRGRERDLAVRRKPNLPLAAEFRPAPIRRCANKCVFCFIDQMPPGLRQRLYIKDEDLGHSFINGNYVTLSNAPAGQLDRVVRLGLSPLFVSVHVTDTARRRAMLGNSRARPIMDVLRRLAGQGIAFHTQIVVCPGWNDGRLLGTTLRDLLSLGPQLLSVAVVPVGLTRFRSRCAPLAAVTPAIAAQVCAQAGRISDTDLRRSGTRRVFLADEFFLRAGLAIPAASYYGDYPQIENGVGLVRQLLDEWNRARRRFPARAIVRQRRKRYFLATSVSALPFIKTIAAACERLRPDLELRVAAVENRFFGQAVTVAGLCTGRDLLATYRVAAGKFDGIIAPAVMFNYAGFTLDGCSAERLSRRAGTPLLTIEKAGDLLELR